MIAEAVAGRALVDLAGAATWPTSSGPSAVTTELLAHLDGGGQA